MAGGSVEQELMEEGATDATAWTCGKGSLSGGGFVEKTDALEWVAFEAV